MAAGERFSAGEALEKSGRRQATSIMQW